MTNEFDIKIGELNKKVYFLDDFYKNINIPSALHVLHDHRYTEIHFILHGNATLRTDTSEYILQAGDMIAIPKGVFHEHCSSDIDFYHIAFQIDININDIIIKGFPDSLTYDFKKEMELANKTHNHITVATYISLFCTKLFPLEALTTKPVRDYGLIIGEYFSANYRKNIRLSDLAKELSVSEKQAERLVLKHTGSTFKKYLSAYRIKIAEHLVQDHNMSLSETAHYVGYDTYSGFWKAYTKYKEEKSDRTE